MKILFLDIDGVLNSEKFFLAKPKQDRTFMPRNDDAEMFDPAAVAVLNEIIEKSGCKVVISSSWRAFMPWDELINLLTNVVGIKADFIDKTPKRFSYVPRGGEIRSWLASYYNELNRGEKTEPIEGIVILDDDYTVHERSHNYGFKNHWVRTFWDKAEGGEEQGLLPKHVAEALEKINRPFKFKLKPYEKEEVSPEDDQ